MKTKRLSEFLTEAEVRTVQELLGHSHIRTTEKYLHTSDEKKIDAVSRLQFAL